VPVKSGGTLGETVSEVSKEEREFLRLKTTLKCGIRIAEK